MVLLQTTARSLRSADNLSDDELVNLARDRNENAVRELVRRYNQRLFRITRGIVRDEAEAEDVVQATYVRAFTHLDHFRGEAAFSTWLTRIALNEAYGRIRRRRTMVELSEIDTPGQKGHVIMFPMTPGPADPETSAGRAQVQHVLQRALDHLPEPFRLVFLLREVEGLSVEETAETLSIKPETVKTRLFRARRLMRKEIEKTVSTNFKELFPFAGARCARMADKVVAALSSYAKQPPTEPVREADDKSELPPPEARIRRLDD